MTILITGATGLVGERLVPRLVEAGLACRLLLRAGKTCPPGATAMTGDILDPSTLSEAVRGVSAIVHLAAVFRSPDTDLIWRSNLEGTRNLIAAVQANAPDARFIMASTSNVYNKNSTQPGRETDSVEPEQAYPASKVAAEKLLRESGLNWSILRFPFVYGDGDGHLEMLPKHLVAFGFHPANRMSTIHHRDIATAMRLALAGAFDGRIVNISDEAPTTVYELAGLVGQKMEPSAEAMQNPWYLHVDASLARSLGFRPIVRTVYQAAQEKIL
ncbi:MULTISPECIES: NAD(P)-dependent oxidoreductase [unclassified Neorhizobium]|uniref:NAD-dependent epimerase/dehydratase family protein n=1 Tax=unclassified Neorhizobium TaxID=2629175 RepID=UPI001FF2F2D9|nr:MULTISPECIES: NAD(P)-dependent oxidoreductase [unclassified Neorhizobium]MCJ9671410.1 NAD(P)-dependent oxidoreductase [Neorhizobium sp. SHOUNA12B]MCJ9746362.1 NAD(P)-dependent oxidoreductase [Neorhizobium sp. SHOUNA12A]